MDRPCITYAPLVDDFPRRIMTRATQETASVPVEAHRRVADALLARERFERSRFIASLWPWALRERTVDYFEWQHQIDEGFRTLAHWQPPSTAGLDRLDRILTHTSLHTLALWSLGTGDREQVAVASLAARGYRLEELIGMGALASRDYPRAAEAFSRASGDANVYREAYALAMAGQRTRVATLAAAARARQGRLSDDAFWEWMERRFGPVAAASPPIRN